MTLVKAANEEAKGPFDKATFVLHKEWEEMGSLTPRSLHILKLLWTSGDRKTVYSFRINQTELAHKLQVTRQALSIHLKRLRELGFVQVGRGFVSVTEDGVRAIGYRSNPVIMTVRVSPSKRLEAFGRIKVLPAVEIYTVTGDVDFVLIVEQDRLDQVLGMLSKIDGVLETKSLVSIEVASHE